MFVRTYSRKLFWFSSAIGLVLIIANLPGAKKGTTTDGDHLQIEEAHLQKKIEPEVFEETKLASTGEKAMISKSGRTMIVSGKRYVKIDEKWFLERPDHTYMVKGVKTYFVDRPPEAKHDEKSGEDKSAAENTSLVGKASRVFQPYTPEDIGTTMENLKRAKKTIEDRSKVLDELSRPEK